MKQHLNIFWLLIILTTLNGCQAFMHGYTWSKAANSYYLVTDDSKNFGNKRIKYNKNYHRNSQLSNFLRLDNERGVPNFIFEYQTDTKCKGIRLFYLQIDSVFIFEEPKKGNLRSVLKEKRKIDEYERQTYQQLKEGKR